MRVTSFLPVVWQPTQEERKATWRKLFSRQHRRNASDASSNGSTTDSIGVADLTNSSTAGSTRSATPELPDAHEEMPPMIPRRSSRRVNRLSMMSDIDIAATTNMYPAPLNLTKRPSTSSSASSPTSSTSEWSGFFSTHPALSPLGRGRPMSVFSQREYEPTIDEEPEYITLQDEDQLILTLTSKYPTGVAAELYVPVDVSVPRRPAIGRRISERVRPRNTIGEQSALRKPRPMSMYGF